MIPKLGISNSSLWHCVLFAEDLLRFNNSIPLYKRTVSATCQPRSGETEKGNDETWKWKCEYVRRRRGVAKTRPLVLKYLSLGRILPFTCRIIHLLAGLTRLQGSYDFMFTSICSPHFFLPILAPSASSELTVKYCSSLINRLCVALEFCPPIPQTECCVTETQFTSPSSIPSNLEALPFLSLFQ